MATTLFSLRFPRFKPTPAIAIVASLIASNSACAASPFDKFAGGWSGAGQIVGTNSHRESIRCRAQYTEEKESSALNQSIVCASESFKLNITSYSEVSGDSVQGYWKEASRDVSGHLAGRISDGRFEGEFSATTFSAGITLASTGRTQSVIIQPHGGEISEVRIELRR